MTAEQRREQARRAGQARARQFLQDPDYQRNAGKSRAKAFTPSYQAEAVSHRTRESLVANGKKAFATLVRKHGLDGALEHLAEHRRKNPSKLEKAVADWLDAREITYQREARVAGVYVDFILDDGKTVIFTDGAAFHNPETFTGRDYVGRDALHDMALASNGYRVIRLAEADILSGAAFTQLEKQL